MVFTSWPNKDHKCGHWLATGFVQCRSQAIEGKIEEIWGRGGGKPDSIHRGPERVCNIANQSHVTAELTDHAGSQPKGWNLFPLTTGVTTLQFAQGANSTVLKISAHFHGILTFYFEGLAYCLPETNQSLENDAGEWEDEDWTWDIETQSEGITSLRALCKFCFE